MSDDTAHMMREAIHEHLVDETGGEIPTAWVLIAATTTIEDMDDNTSTIHIETSPGQSVFTTDGLLFNALQRNMG